MTRRACRIHKWPNLAGSTTSPDCKSAGTAPIARHSAVHMDRESMTSHGSHRDGTWPSCKHIWRTMPAGQSHAPRAGSPSPPHISPAAHGTAQLSSSSGSQVSSRRRSSPLCPQQTRGPTLRGRPSRRVHRLRQCPVAHAPTPLACGDSHAPTPHTLIRSPRMIGGVAVLSQPTLHECDMVS